MSSLPSNPSESFKKLNPHLFCGDSLNKWAKVAEDAAQLNPQNYGTTNQTDRVAPASERQQDSGHEPLAKAEGEDRNAVRCLVRVESFRLRLLDERNLWDKYFVDALVKAGLLRDDSPNWCKVKVVQTKVKHPELERTEITVKPL